MEYGVSGNGGPGRPNLAATPKRPKREERVTRSRIIAKTVSRTVREWLRGGPQDDVVISSRVRLARSVDGFPFLSKASSQEIARIEELLRNKIQFSNLPHDLAYYRLDELTPLVRQLLAERHLIGAHHRGTRVASGVAFCPCERLCVIVNEEDHLRIQVICGGLQLRRAFEEARAVDCSLAEVIPLAFSARYGYLTACPTNVGTGMRASIMVHLPALVMAREVDKVIHLAGRLRLALRGLHGEGAQVSADFYQLSNQVSLGVTEEEILDVVSEAASEVLELEREARDAFLNQHRTELQDKTEAALNLLASAAAISSEEALHLLSQVRMGVEMKLVKQVTVPALNEMLLLTLPAHLQTIEGGSADSLGSNEVRAAYLREKLSLN